MLLIRRWRRLFPVGVLLRMRLARLLGMRAGTLLLVWHCPLLERRWTLLLQTSPLLERRWPLLLQTVPLLERRWTLLLRTGPLPLLWLLRRPRLLPGCLLQRPMLLRHRLLRRLSRQLLARLRLPRL